MELASYKKKGRLNNKHLLTLRDYSVGEIYEILSCALRLKFLQKKGKKHEYLKGKTLAMIFEKSSTRTRVSFEQGIRQLGGSPMFLSSADIQLGRNETVHDTVQVLNRYDIDGIMMRTFEQSKLDELARYGNMPVINGLSDDFHPCQVLADLMTVYEAYGRFGGVKLSYFGDGGNVANSLMIGGAKVGLDVCVCGPAEYAPKPEIVAEARKFGKVTVTDDLDEAARDCDVLYSDVFFSMGQKPDQKKEKALMPYQVNAGLMAKTNPDSVFMHCLPAHRGEEVTTEVIDGPRSIVFEEAENRLHVQKAVMYLLMK
ncbi:MAG: ornithine carbamoyltransferase [Clostridiales bacterium]|jgi:ornithine carbamoyltransferase|nr:ornithine carbamoyltransferase [Clostridiales bacterium]